MFVCFFGCYCFAFSLYYDLLSTYIISKTFFVKMILDLAIPRVEHLPLDIARVIVLERNTFSSLFNMSKASQDATIKFEDIS